MPTEKIPEDFIRAIRDASKKFPSMRQMQSWWTQKDWLFGKSPQQMYDEGDLPGAAASAAIFSSEVETDN